MMSFNQFPARVFSFCSAVDRQRLTEEAAAWRAARRTVAVAPGCFDLFGPHHLYLLREAAKLASWLVVALNSDESVCRLKGPTRPVYSAVERVEILQQIRYVDYIVLFSTDTPRDLLSMLRPDVLVKGDVPGQTTDGEEFAANVVRIPLKAGKSTTLTIERLRQVTTKETV
jgi:D-beta-D-heptose 7-phosphate kinase/D-beta-D-heptose 1-phosphate adenosyltransferase